MDPRTLRVLPVAPHYYLGCRSGSSGFDLGSVGSVVPRRARLVLVAPRRCRSLCYLFFLSLSPCLSLSLPLLLFLSPSLLYLVSLCTPVSLSLSPRFCLLTSTVREVDQWVLATVGPVGVLAAVGPSGSLAIVGPAIGIFLLLLRLRLRFDCHSLIQHRR